MVSMREANASVKRYLKRCSRMMRELFGGSLPVFVASIISRAMMSIIYLLSSGNAHITIAFTFVYAFCFLQTLGVVIIARFNHGDITFPYILHVVTEVTGFAWKEFVTLIMLKWLFEYKLVGAAFGAWLLILFIAFVMVYFFNAALALYFKPSAAIFEGLRDFNTDALSLAIAFSFTLIAASQIYPAESAGNLASSDSEHAIDIREEHGLSAYIFLAYSFGITVIIAALTWKLAPHVSTAEENGEFIGHVGFGNPLEGEDSDIIMNGGDGMTSGNFGDEQSPIASLAATHAEALKASEDENEFFFSSLESTGPNRASVGESVKREEGNDTNTIRPVHSIAVHPMGTSSRKASHKSDDIFSAANLGWSYLDNLLFAWDPNGYSKSSLAHLVNTSGGYTVGCAWYTYALLTFQDLFSTLTNGRLLGLFLYALCMTAIVVFLMQRIEKRQSRVWARQLATMSNQSDQRDLSAYRSRYKRNTELVRVAGRLLCGWSWADFVSVCADTAIVDAETAEMTKFHSSSWIGAVIKCLIAAIFFAMGACYVHWRYRQSQARAQRLSLSSISSSRTGSRGLSLQEHKERHAALQAEFEAHYGEDGYEDEGGEYSVLDSSRDTDIDVDVEDHRGFKAPLLGE